MKKVLVTGGLGFVGGRIVRMLADSFEVQVSSRKQPDTETLRLHNNPGYVLHADLLDEKKFPVGIDTVIHMAALNEWDCVERPSEAIQVNIDQTRMVLENAIQKGVSQFIYFSTAHIYGSPLQGNITEATLPEAQHPYAITHRAAEDYVVAATRQNKIQGVVLRLSNSFGAPVSPSVNRWTLLANDLAKQAIEKQSLTLLSNGCQLRDFITLEDVEQAVLEIVKGGNQKFTELIYNLGSGKAVRVIDMAERIIAIYKDLSGLMLPLHLPPQSKPSIEPPLYFSVERLNAAGFQPANNIDEELKQLLHFCEQHFKPISIKQGQATNT